MFKINDNPAFWNEVVVNLPGEEPQTFRARFGVMDITCFKSYDFNDPEAVEEFLNIVVKDVADIDYGDGKPYELEYLVDQLCRFPHIRGALIRSYLDGVTRAARGN